VPLNLKIKVPRLGRNRLGVYYVRYPSYVDDQGRRRVVQKSLRTKDPVVAKVLALRFCLGLSIEDDPNNMHDPREGVSPWILNLSEGQFEANGDDDTRNLLDFMSASPELVQSLIELQKRKVAIQQAAAAPVQPPSPAAHAGASLFAATRLEDALRMHLDVERPSLQASTIHEKTVLFRDFMEVFGADADVRSITAEQITKRWMTAEAQRPNQKRKGATLSLNRLEKRRSFLAKFFDWAQGSGLYPHDNPLKAKFAKKKQIRRQSRPWEEFTADELKVIFSAQYVQRMDKPDFYWIPLMALFSGARLGELCELRLEDFRVVEGIPVFDVLDGKTDSSRRRVPIHSILQELGLLEFVDALKARGAVRLLHHRSPDYLSKAVGRQWGDWLKACGVKTDRKVFHSFRSTAITDLHNANAKGVAIRRAVGHASSETEGVHGDYVRGIHLENLRDAIETLQFPMIDFLSLALEDPTFKDFFDKDEKVKSAPGYKKTAGTATGKCSQAEAVSEKAAVGLNCLVSLIAGLLSFC